MNTALKNTLAAACCALAVTGCGGGGASRGLTPSPAAGGIVPASIVIRIPALPATASAARRARYVGVLSRSATLALAPAQTCTNCTPASSTDFSLAGQGSIPCVTNAQGRSCTFPLNLMAGAYTGTMTLYDGFLNGQGHVTGTALSEKTAFPVVVAVGQSNAIGVVLDGVPASLKVTVLTPATLVVGSRVVQGQQFSTYRMIGNGSTAQFSVTATDPDGYAIVGGGAPAYTASASGGFGASATGNTITLHAPAAYTKQPGALSVDAVSGASPIPRRCAPSR